MDFIKQNVNKVVGGIVILVILFFVYTEFIKNTEDDFTGSSTEIVVGNGIADEASREILRTLDILEDLKIDGDFFNEDLSSTGNLISFSELFDFSEQEITRKNTGKDNPFSEASRYHPT